MRVGEWVGKKCNCIYFFYKARQVSFLGKTASNVACSYFCRNHAATLKGFLSPVFSTFDAFLYSKPNENAFALFLPETPLTVGVTLGKDRTRDVLIALISGGAHIDFRNRSGLTAMHRAAIVGNAEAIKVCFSFSYHRQGIYSNH
jgi:SH3/ankyrin repeat-containing protein